jgi:hypothetical protein
MTQNLDQDDKKPIYEWQELDQAIRRWAISSQFEQDLEKYHKLKEENDTNAIRGYN